MEESTPKKTIQEKEAQNTNIKPGEDSQYQPEQSYDKVHTSDETLDHIEGEIKHLGQRLEAISEEKRNYQAGSEEFQNLEDERRVLRKEIIDLDYHHKMTMIQRRKDREAQKEETRNAPEEQQKPKEENQQEEAEKKEGEEEKKEGEEEKKESEEERNIAEERYRARIREIQVELAASRLRRSRQVQLEADLIAVRALTPYYWWRYYDRPAYYPLYRDPLYYSSLYPYSYPLLYPRYYPYAGFYL